MDVAGSISEFQDKAQKLWEALSPKLTALRTEAEEAILPHVASAKESAVEVWSATSTWLWEMEADYPGLSVLVCGVALALCALLYESARCCSSRKARSESFEPPAVNVVEAVAPRAKPEEPTVIHVASPQRWRSSEPVVTLPAEPSGSGLRRSSSSLVATADRLSSMPSSEMRRRSSTPRGFPEVAERFRNQGMQQLEARNRNGVLHFLNEMTAEDLNDVKNIGPVSVNKILIQRRRGGFANFDAVLECLGKTQGQKIVTSLDALLDN